MKIMNLHLKMRHKIFQGWYQKNGDAKNDHGLCSSHNE